MSSVVQRLHDLGLILPEPTPVTGNYMPYVVCDGLLSISGQTCKVDGDLAYSGPLNSKQPLSIGVEAARICALNLLSQLGAACGGDWERVKACIKLTVFVNSTPEFLGQPSVANGASDVIVAALGDRGLHTRSAVGVSSLPGG